MMADNSHIDEIEAQAALFALSALPPEDARLFEQRLAAGCPLCRAQLQEFESVVAALPLSVPDIEPKPDLRARLLERIGGEARPAMKSSIGQGVIVRAGDTKWRPSPVPGVQMRSLLDQKTMLVRMAPQTWYPAHNHSAAEQCLVLEGAVSCDGVTAYSGDFTYMPAGSSHQPLYSEGGCLLLIAYT